jgi:hypothetical protein
MQILAPDLSPAGKLELRESYELATWKPALGPGSEPVQPGAAILVLPPPR